MSQSDKAKSTAVEFIRYAAVCGFVLGVKTGLTWLMAMALPAMIAYLIVHVIIFFVSYVSHCRVTFRTTGGTRKIRDYFLSVIGFKVADYLIFAVAFKAFHLNSVLSVLVASAGVMVVRFIVVRKVLKRPEKPKSEDG